MKRFFAIFAIAAFLMFFSLAKGEENLQRVMDTTALPPQVDESKDDYGKTPQEFVPYGKFTKPYRRFFLQPLQYRGYGRHLPEPEHVKSVKIGFIGPIMKTVSVATGGASHEEPMGIKMLEGARLAIEQANAKGGYRGKTPYELVVKNDNGLWGASGNEIINLAYQDNVWAILGTIDGANSHIAIRVALKIEIPMMNTGDTDPTFIETNIPWVFRCLTDDRQMCYLLADYAFKKLGVTRIAALRANNRYGRISIDEFRDGATRLGFPFLAELNYKVGDKDFAPQLERIKALKPEAVITYGDAVESAMILKQMRSMGMDQWFLGSDRLVTKEFIDIVGKEENKVVAGYPYNPASEDSLHIQFQKDFKERYGDNPETYAAHGYDGMNMTIQAIEKGGLNRALIRDELAEMTTFDGVTGKKEIDPIFSNRSPAYLAILKNGVFTFHSRQELFGEG
ncbi:MAG: ABC transporter substrate-binding protein [Candidatus Omnitrophota bacterium]